ncbi:MAG: potassium-transporting ATPase subunit KdpB [Planctomycetes bacterium]|nr:potassium-transporting ATPase subunit KdpB [Planctomycetota bacterium]
MTGRRDLLLAALGSALRRLEPLRQARNPVMFVTWIGAAFTTLLALAAIAGVAIGTSVAFTGAIAVWLWLTVLFANLGEALAEGRGRAHADALRRARRDTPGKRLHAARRDASFDSVPASALMPGDLVLVEEGALVPADGEVIEGVATVDESAITGESAPVIRESGGDRSSVTGGTRVLSDWLICRVASRPGDSFLDRMIAMVEGGRRRMTPNESALNTLLAALTIVFLLACATLVPISGYAAAESGTGRAVPLAIVVALLVCLIPTTIGGLLAAIRIAGLDRMVRHNVVATSGKAVEAAGDVDVLLLDKTGTITLGARQATRFLAAPGVGDAVLADAAQLASLADETPEGRSIVVLAKQRGLRERDLAGLGGHFVPFRAQTRMSGADLPGRTLRKGAADAVRAHVAARGAAVPAEVDALVLAVARHGSTPLVVVENERVLGVIELKDVVKGGIQERFAELRRMGIRTVMITGDNPVTAAAIAAEAGVDDFLAEATPEAKLELIREYQRKGHLVAMAGDGTNDAPALAQADVAVAMNTGTQAAKEAGNMVDLDSNPTKLVEIVAVGKQLLMTRGALTTFSIANDVAKYFAILPAALVGLDPNLAALDVMGLHAPGTAILAAVIFNALVLVALVPLALRGVRSRARGAAQVLRTNLLVYGLGGLVAPFLGIKLLDELLFTLGVR